MVINASLLDDVEVASQEPAAVEVWTPGGARPKAKPAIPAKVDLWAPGQERPAAAPRLPPMRAQQPTMLVPISKKRHRHRKAAALAVAACLAAALMLVVVLVWRFVR